MDGKGKKLLELFTRAGCKDAIKGDIKADDLGMKIVCKNYYIFSNQHHLFLLLLAKAPNNI